MRHIVAKIGESMAEGYELAKRAGFDPNDVCEIWNDGRLVKAKLIDRPARVGSDGNIVTRFEEVEMP